VFSINFTADQITFDHRIIFQWNMYLTEVKPCTSRGVSCLSAASPCRPAGVWWWRPGPAPVPQPPRVTPSGPRHETCGSQRPPPGHASHLVTFMMGRLINWLVHWLIVIFKHSNTLNSYHAEYKFLAKVGILLTAFEIVPIFQSYWADTNFCAMFL